MVKSSVSSMIDGERVVIGSYHFVVEDEACKVPDEHIFRHLPKEYSHLYLAIGGEIAAVICIEDPLREEAGAVIETLHRMGLSNIMILYALISLKQFSDAMMKRIHQNYRTIIGFNTGLINLGAAGILPPATSALLHNASTLAIVLKNMTDLPV